MLFNSVAASLCALWCIVFFLFPSPDSLLVDEVLLKLLKEVKGSHVKSSASPKEYEVYVQMGLACNGCAYIYVGKHIPSGSFVAIRKVNLENCPVKFDDLAVGLFYYSISFLNLYGILVENCYDW